jgi:YfiR/HmsC-like
MTFGPGLRRTVSVVCLVGCMCGVPAQVPAPTEAALKAGFVYNFGKFTEWPAQALPTAQVQLCVVGSDGQGMAATAAVDGRALQNRTVRVRRGPRPDELKTCQIVYVTDADERRATEVLRQLRGQPVLTVGDIDGFTDLGGMIGLGMTAGRVHFDINHEAVQAAGLRLSSQLLRLARNVKGAGL